MRDRKADIPELVDYFLKYFSKKLGKNVTKVQKDVYEMLNNYSFPGNIRELRNLMERAVILCTNSELSTQNFQLFKLAANSESSLLPDTLDLEELEKQAIIRALEKTNNNKSEAARLLNIEWNALYRRLQKYNITI